MKLRRRPDAPRQRGRLVPPTEVGGGPSGWVARRLDTTDGQVQTLAIGLVVAVALFVAGVPAALRDSVVRTVLPGDVVTVAAERLPDVVRPAPGTFSPGAAQPLTPVTSPTTTLPVPDDSVRPPAPPKVCQLGDQLETAKALLVQLRPLVPVVPSKSLPSLLAYVAGCSAEDPSIVVAAIVADIGAGLPDPGPVAEVPSLPYGELLTPEVAGLLAGATPVLEPVCSLLGTSAVVAFLSLQTYPQAVKETAIAAITDGLQVCARLVS